ncbi:hypothetical protein CSKR_105841 [Clonorchis sinensis]|uniref:Uncharacterized protein n=1 Tax=Clonorchis sinensis TaxID=79923 RepID=A0A3R7C2B3_CLOSI|nr:hypothetical protein CSKR_105841 [Clonorchis sinensis]
MCCTRLPHVPVATIFKIPSNVLRLYNALRYLEYRTNSNMRQPGAAHSVAEATPRDFSQLPGDRPEHFVRHKSEYTHSQVWFQLDGTQGTVSPIRYWITINWASRSIQLTCSSSVAFLLRLELTDRKIRSSNQTPTFQLLPSRIGQLGSIPALVLPLGGMAARHRNGCHTSLARKPVKIPGIFSSSLLLHSNKGR